MLESVSYVGFLWNLKSAFFEMWFIWNKIHWCLSIIWWVFTCVYSCVTTKHDYDIYSISITPESFLKPLCSNPLPLFMVPVTDLLSITIILLFLKIFITGSVQYLVFCAWLLSHSVISLEHIYVVACFSSLFLFIAFCCINLPQFVELTDMWVIFTFGLSWIKLLWTFDYRSLYWHMLIYTFFA